MFLLIFEYFSTFDKSQHILAHMIWHILSVKILLLKTWTSDVIIDYDENLW